MHLSLVSTSRAALLAAVVLSPLAPALAAPHTMPTPGLYQVDTVADQKYDRLDVKTTPLADRSGVVMDSKAAGKPAERHVLKGKPAAPVCIAANTPYPGFTPPRGSCTGAPAVNGPDGFTFGVACGFADVSTVVRKLDAKTWEYQTTSVEYEGVGGVAGIADFSTQKKMHEVTARSGATPEERADAAETLRNWSAYEAEMRASIAELAKEEAEAAKQAGSAPAANKRKVLRKTTAVTRWTKIAATCTPVAGTLPTAR